MPESRTDVSVIVPVRNRPTLLREALSSVLAGSALPDEVIVVLDGPSDAIQSDREAALDMQQDFEKHRCSLLLLPAPGAGPALARNIGAARARSSFLAFLDSDDLWKPQKLQHQLQYMKKRPHLHASHCTEEWIKNGQRVHVPARLQPAPGRLLVESLDHCVVSASSVLIRRSTFFSLGGFDPTLRACEDYDLWIRYFLRHPMGLVDLEPLVIKRSGPWEQLSSIRGIDLFRVQSLLKILRTEHLTAEEDQLVREALQAKWNILLAQKKKYGFPEDAQYNTLEKKIESLNLMVGL